MQFQFNLMPSWMAYVPSVLFFLLAIAVIMRSLIVPADLGRRPCCGACGHPTTEPLGERCNECGALLARAGVVTPVLVARLRGFLPLALIAWTAVCGTLSVHGYALARQAAWNAAQTRPAVQRKSQVTPVSVELGLEPQSWSGGFARVDGKKLNFRVQAILEAQAKDGIAQSGTLEITIRKNGAASLSVTTITIPSGAYTTTDRDAKSKTEGEKFGEEEAKAALALAGVDTDYKPIATTIKDLVALAETSIVDPEGVSSLYGGMNGSEPAGSLSARSIGGGAGLYATAPWAPAQPKEPWEMREVQVGAGVMAATYVVGLALITWRHRRITTFRTC